ncbi:hypothetical protein [Streptomyces sp. KMM 9044]|uniref:hypothetical protein n=1 Tax=Streptomyces sp. KMM 9044 TaxID=2744474 RepID=UPI002151144D|nr:hypothetical protein [Streptomyces sp. KMM 9044]WAX79595.1 hypothetical protein HUV60_019895 [Streptomyces sp. KMM 9044]
MAPLNPGGLFPGEGLMPRKNANAVIGVREAGLSRFALAGLTGAVGMRGRRPSVAASV